MASIVMLSSLFIQTGPAAGGWTIYPPLSALGQASEGSKIGNGSVDRVSMALFIVSSLLGGLNYISTILNMRTKGMSMTRLPLNHLGIVLYSGIGCIIIPCIFIRR